MIGLKICAVALVVVGVMSDSPGGRSGATSFSTYHRKYEPSNGRSGYHGGKSAPKNSPRAYTKESASSYSQDSAPSRDSFSNSPSPYSDGPNYSRSGPNYDGPSSPSSYSSDSPSHSSPGSNGPPNYSGESFKSGPSEGPSSSPSFSSSGPSHDAPHHPVNSAPPHSGAPSHSQHDLPFNNGFPNSFIPSGQAHIPQFASHAPVPQHQVHFGFPSYSPHVSLLAGGQHHFPLHIPKQPLPIAPLITSFGHQGQFSYAGDKASPQFSTAPLKVYQPVAIQPPLLLASSKVPLVYRPSYQPHQSGSPISYGRQFR